MVLDFFIFWIFMLPFKLVGQYTADQLALNAKFDNQIRYYTRFQMDFLNFAPW